MRLELSRYISVAEAVSKLLSPFAEVVIHDLSTNKIEAIFNSISKREVGDSSYLDHINLETYDELSNVIGPYEKLNYDGRKLKCIIAVIRDNDSVAIGTLCINLDISVFDKYQGVLQLFLTNNDKEMSQKSQSLFRDTLYEQINNFVQKYCLNHNLSIDNLTRLQKKI